MQEVHITNKRWIVKTTLEMMRRRCLKAWNFLEMRKASLVACKLFTGRTHQIRVRFETINRHIIGDHIYGVSPKQEKSERILLHAYTIYFIHPTSKEKVSFDAPLDAYMKDYIDKKFNSENINEVMDTSYILHSFTADS